MKGRSGQATDAARTGRTRRRRVLPAEVRVDDLVSAAAELFIARGIDATTVDDIVERAGVAKGTFYHYFSTKADVIQVLQERFSRDFIARVAATVDACPSDDHPARLSAWIRGAAATYLANFELHDVVFHNFTHNRRQSEAKDAVIAQIVALLEEGKEAGAWTFPDTRTVALVLFHGMHGVVDDAIVSDIRDPQPLCRRLEELFSRMLVVGER